MPIYEGQFENGNLVLTPLTGRTLTGKAFNPAAQKQIAQSELTDKLSVIESSFPGASESNFYVGIKGQELRDFVIGLSIDDIRANATGLVEIDSMSAALPIETLENSWNKENRNKVETFLRDVFNDVAAGKENEYGYKTTSFINPAAVESIEDMGGYRSINFKAGFGGKPEVVSALPADELKKRLRIGNP